MNKKVLSMLLSAAAIITVQARHLSPDEALSRVINQSQGQQSGNIQKAPALSPNATLMYSADVDRQPMAYVFGSNSEKGFMVVSADDVAMPLLGYSDNNSFDPENIPTNLKAWLDGYARQIAYAANNASFAGSPVAAAAERTERQPVEPKITTTWDQDAPYWNDCPTLSGNRCYTGCVATAMAQVMNYHKWPEKGQGSISYRWTAGNQTLSCNFADITFKWDKMLDHYTSTSPAENCAAVAELMKACGYASQMQYHYLASGTTGFSAAAGLIKYFNYDQSLAIQYRDWYNMDEWEDIVYTELTTNGPVYYDGTGSDGGHAFVCDGYRANGYFHFNWGWGGLSDGYFLLNALSPGSQGAGGNTTGFNFSQSIMQNLSKPKTGSTPTAIIAANGGFTTSTTSTTLGRTVTFVPVEAKTGFYSYSTTTINNLTIGVKYVNNATGATSYMTSYTTSLNPLYGFTQISVQLPYVLTEGSYTVTPAYRTGSGDWQDMKTEGAYNNAMTMTVTGSTVTFTEVGAETKISASEVSLQSAVTSTGQFSVQLKLTCSGKRDFNGLVEARFLNSSGGVIDSGDAYSLFMSPGETMTVIYKSAPLKGALRDGTYSLRFYSPTSKEYISNPIEVQVADPLQFTCSQLRMSGASSVDCNNVTISANVTCESGKYNGPLAFIASSSSENLVPVGMFLSEDMTFSTKESKAVSFSGVFEEGEVGHYYYAALAYKGEDGTYHQIGTSMVRFRVTTASGIDDIMAEQQLKAAVIYPNPAESMATLESPTAIQTVEVYSLSGTALNVQADIDGNRATLNVAALSSGTYIVVATGTDASRHTAKLIKR